MSKILKLNVNRPFVVFATYSIWSFKKVAWLDTDAVFVSTTTVIIIMWSISKDSVPSGIKERSTVQHITILLRVGYNIPQLSGTQ